MVAIFLTCYNIAVSLRTTRFNIKKFYIVLVLSDLYGSQNKQRLSLYTSLTDCFL